MPDLSPTARALVFWLLRVALAALLVLALRAWQGPDPILWWLWLAYAAISLFTTAMLIRSGRGR